MLILKLAFLTSVFYLGTAVLLETGLVLWARHSGSIGYTASRSAWFLFFGVMWLGCFSMAWHIGYTGIQRQLHH
jgi:hypothetical protein